MYLTIGVYLLLHICMRIKLILQRCLIRPRIVHLSRIFSINQLNPQKKTCRTLLSRIRLNRAEQSEFITYLGSKII